MRSASLLALLFAASAARADLPAPRLDRVFPMGAAAGSAVEVEVAGADIEGAKRLFFDHPGITATHLKDRTFRVAVGKDVPPGTYDARVIGKYGLSSPRLFAVSHGLTEVLKKKGNDTSETAQPVTVNSAVNGTVDGSRDDFYRFPAKKGQRVVVECQAQALDSQLSAVLAVTDADGKPLGANGGYFGRDPLVEFVAPKDGDYLASVHDLSYRGGLPYRLVVTDGPHVENVFPRAVQTGKPAAVTVFGRNLGAGAKPSAWAVNDLKLDELATTVTPPAGGGFRFAFHPTTHSVLPTAATATLTGFQFRGVPMVLSDGLVTVEQEPNDDPAKPQRLTLPAVVSGRFDKERDADWYEFETAEGGSYGFDVYCERIAGRADPYLVVQDDKGNRVGELDDFGARMNAFDGHLRDPSGTVNLQPKKTYRVLVQDRYRRGGARFQYVLGVRKAMPDFAVSVIHGQNPGPAAVNVRRGGATYLDVLVHRKDGFGEAVTITADGLPKGLHLPPTTIPTDTRGVLVFHTDPDAAEFVGPVKLTATGGGRSHEVRPYTRVWPEANVGTSRPTRELLVAVLPDPDPFALRFEKDRVEVEAGKKVELKLALARTGDFKGGVTVVPLGLPNPFKMGQITIPEGKAAGAVVFDVQANARPGTYVVAVQGQGQVPFVKDGAKAGARPNTLVARPSPTLAVVVLAAKK